MIYFYEIENEKNSFHRYEDRGLGVINSLSSREVQSLSRRKKSSSR